MKKNKTQAESHMLTIERMYGRDIGLKFDKPLGIYLREKGYPSLAKLIEGSSAQKSSQETHQ